MQTARNDMGLCHEQTWHAPYRRVLLAWCSLVLILGVGTGQAVMRKLSMAELVRKADTIVLGTVIEKESAWDVDHIAIYTDVTLAVERVLVGKTAEVVTLRVAGGVVGNLGMHTSNDAKFKDGEQVIVFLDTSAVPSTVVVLQQGKFTVRNNMVTGAGETYSLDEFIAAVRTAAR